VAESQDSIDFTPHSDKQERALFAEKRILLVGCGTQWGKTQVGGLRMKLKMHTFTDKADNFIVTAPNYKIMEQSTLPAFLRFMEGYGTYKDSKALFLMNEGGTCYFRTETDPDSVVGIPNVRHIWCDEAGKYGLYFWENILARADAVGCGVDLTTSPYSRNWIYKDLVRPASRGTRKDIELVQAASWENPYHSLSDPKKRLERQATMDIRRFNMLFGGEWGQMAGLVYDCWDDDQNYIDAFSLPTGTRFYAGVDWGHTHPCVIHVRAVTLDGMHYGVGDYWATGRTISDIVETAKAKKAVWGIQTFFCDPSQPAHIEEFNRHGLSAVPADNDIRHGIDMHYELIKTRKYKEFRGACPHAADEREMYHYPDADDLGPDDNAKDPLPVKQHDDVMDTQRYVTAMTYRRQEKITPKLSGERPRYKTRLQELQNSWRRRHYETYND
jgi:hypothetical protein